MNKSILHSAITAAMVISITACSSGGSDVAGIGGSGITSSGTITGFGSFYLNGVKYDDNTATVTSDDNPNFTKDDLRLGMRVTVTGTVNPDGTGTANTVSFSGDLEGPVSGLVDVGTDGLIREFRVLGRLVRINADTTSFDVTGALAGTTFDFGSIVDGNHVEVSGYLDNEETMIATRVELKATNFNHITSVVELKGTVVGFNPANNTFTLRNAPTVTIDATGVTPDNSLPNGIEDDAFVEVKGQCSSAACTTVNATKVESGLEDFSDNDDVEFEGIITNVSGPNTFEVNGIPVDASSATRIPTSFAPTLNQEVEVEGTMSGNTLVATKVKDESNDIKIEATILNVTPASNSFTLEPVTAQTITVVMDKSTEVDDDFGTITNPDDLINSLSAGQFVSVEGYKGDNNTVVASEVKRESTADDVIVQGIMDSFNMGSDVTVLGVTFVVDGAETEYELANDTPTNQSGFNAAAVPGVTLVKVKDKAGQPVIGTADEIEIELP